MIYCDKLLSAVDAYYKKAASERTFSEQKAEEYLENNDEYSRLKYRIRELKILCEHEKFDKKDTSATEKEIKACEDKFKKLKETLSSNVTVGFHCEKCKDTGNYNGIKCECFFKKLNEYAYDYLGVKNLAEKSFADDTLSEIPQLKSVYDSLKRFANKFPETSKNVLLLGQKGTGKTFLTQCVVNAVCQKDLNAIFLTAFDLNNVFVKQFSLPFGERITTEEILTTCDLLAIDDLGAEPVYNKVTVENLTATISERLANKKPFLITTNLTLDELSDRYGERLFSRLCGKQTVILKMDGKDLRFV